MTPAEYESLRKDVEKNGLIHPIILHDGQILDGRHRYRACVDTGTEPRFETYAGTDPAGLVWSENGTRRNLSTSQRALVAASFLEYEREQAMKRKAANGGDRKSECKNFDTPISDTGRATDKAGAKFGVCGDYVFKAARVLEKAEPEVIDKPMRPSRFRHWPANASQATNPRLPGPPSPALGGAASCPSVSWRGHCRQTFSLIPPCCEYQPKDQQG